MGLLTRSQYHWEPQVRERIWSSVWLKQRCYAQMAIDCVIYIVIWDSCFILLLPCLGHVILLLKGLRCWSVIERVKMLTYFGDYSRREWVMGHWSGEGTCYWQLWTFWNPWIFWNSRVEWGWLSARAQSWRITPERKRGLIRGHLAEVLRSCVAYGLLEITCQQKLLLVYYF